MAKKALTAPQEPDDGAGSKIAEAILHFIGRIPSTDELKSDNPLDRARAIATSAATKAAITAGSLALPPGPFGWVTILPELIAIWKIQAQVVADIAGDRKSTRLNSSHTVNSYAGFCLKKKKKDSEGMLQSLASHKRKPQRSDEHESGQ